MTGPIALVTAWAIHDIEEAIAFPATCEAIATRTEIDALRIDTRQSWLAVGLMGGLVAAVGVHGRRTQGRSRWYRAMVAGLEAHVGVHLAQSLALRGYTAGVVTAPLVMLPGARIARRELAREGIRLGVGDAVRGAALLLPAALACHILARRLAPRRSP